MNNAVKTKLKKKNYQPYPGFTTYGYSVSTPENSSQHGEYRRICIAFQNKENITNAMLRTNGSK